MLCYLDETGEALAGTLRSGNAGSNTARDHFKVLQMALEQLPAEALDREILARADVGGATHAFTADCRSAKIGFSREGAWVSELTDRLDLSAWPEGTRLICRRERPHPGAQFDVFDANGYRHTAFLTDQPGHIASLELRHRRRARVEDAIRNGKECGMRNLPFGEFAANKAWLLGPRRWSPLSGGSERYLPVLARSFAALSICRLRFRRAGRVSACPECDAEAP